MDLINKFLNLVAPPVNFLTLCFFLPPFYIFKSFLCVLSPLFSEDITGKVVLISGASSGIGEHLAYEYAKRGAGLALAARRESRLEDVAETARFLGSPEVITLIADVSKAEDCRRIVQETISHFSRLDHLVNNAGLNSVCLFDEIPVDMTAFKTVMDTNFWGSVFTTRFALPYLRQSRGKIIVLSSSPSWLPAPRMSVYNASKAALLQLFDTLRVELAPHIKITIATPGFIESQLTQGKFITKEGKVDVHQDLRDVQVSVSPVATASGCASSIVKAALRGDRYVTVPGWFKVTYLWKVFCPEVLHWSHQLLYLTNPDRPHEEALSRKIVDLTGTKRLLYPESIQSPSRLRLNSSSRCESRVVMN